MPEISLTEPLLTDGGDEGNIDTGVSSPLTDNVKEAIENAPHRLEYEPSDHSTSDAPTSASPPVKTVRISAPQSYDVLRTSNKPVCVTCKYCNTTCETTVVEAFGTSTCFWVCVLLVLCFPIAWLPFFWKNCHDTKHYCTYCSRELGRAKAKCCQFKKMGEQLDEMEDDLEKRIDEAKVAML